MEVTLEQSLASVVRYVQDKAAAGTKCYFDEIPESFYVPSVYFPVPDTSSRKVTFATYLTTLSVDIWFMQKSDWDANKAASEMRDFILSDDSDIPIVEKDGSISGKHLHIEDVEIRKIDEGIVQLSLRVKSYTRKEETAPVLMKQLRIDWKNTIVN